LKEYKNTKEELFAEFLIDFHRMLYSQLNVRGLEVAGDENGKSNRKIWNYGRREFVLYLNLTMT
jgi:hypothetical protein